MRRGFQPPAEWWESARKLGGIYAHPTIKFPLCGTGILPVLNLLFGRILIGNWENNNHHNHRRFADQVNSHTVPLGTFR
jgi:hypothetical protein